MGLASLMREKDNPNKELVEKPDVRYHSEDLEVDGIIRLQ
jgi:hypothetical protein